MNRTIKDATVRRFYYESHEQLRRHLADFISAYNYGGRLKTARVSCEGLTMRTNASVQGAPFA